ncbi:MAG: efflux transporter periplasmic adaptor subunit, partial [Acinetobacter sp.]
MQTAPHSHDLNMPSPRSILIMSALCLNMFLVACDKNEP